MSQMVWSRPSHSKPRFVEEESLRCHLVRKDRQGRKLTSRRRLVSNLIVLIKRCDKAILQLGYFISNLEQHTLDENKVDSAAVTLRIRLASIRHVRRVW